MTSKPADLSPAGLQDHVQEHLRRWSNETGHLESSSAGPGGQGTSPLRDIHRIAAYWKGSLTRDTGAASSIDCTGPQSLMETGARLGVKVEIESVEIVKLGARHLPCSALMRDGTSVLIVDAPDRKSYVFIGTEGSLEKVSRKALRDKATGTIFIFGQLLPHEGGDAEDSEPRSLRALLFNALKHRKALVASLVFAGLIINCVSLALPLFTMTVFDRVVPHAAFETLWALAIGMAILLLADLAVRHAKLKIADAIGLAAGTALSARIYSRLIHAPLKLVPKTAGVVVHPFADLNAAAQLAPQFMAALIADLPFFGVVIAILAMFGGVIAIVPIVAMVVLFCLQTITHRLSVGATGEEARLAQRQTQMLIDTVASIETLKATTAESRFLSDWERRADGAAFAGHRLRVSHAIVGHVSAFVSQAVVVLTVVIGVYQVSAANMSIGALSACMLLVGRVIQPISGLFGQYFRILQIQETTRGLTVLAAAAAETAADDHAPAKGGIAGRLDLRKVSFSYPDQSSAAVHDLSLVIAPGERVGIVGRAGCGKSSLLRLLIRLHDPTSGDIVLDGRDIRQFDPSEIRRAIALMTQDTVLIDTSLHENLTLGLPDVAVDHFDFICGMTGVSEFAHRHPAGYSLPVGPGGRRLSGGERQSVALARALMGQPKLLLLDEPTSAMDNDRETKVIAGLAQLSPDIGFVIATHRLPALSLVNRVIVMDAGRVVTDGTKGEVFQRLGVKSA